MSDEAALSAHSRKQRRLDRIIAAVVFAATLIALVAGSKTQGNVRDEGYYFDAAELYWSWYGELGDNILAGRPLASFTDSAVRRGFEYNHEHPALMKSLFGMSWRLFHKCDCVHQGGRHPIGYAHPHRTIPILDEEAAMRLPTHILVAAMAAVLFLFGAGAWSRAAGVAAAVLAVAAPRFFFDAQLSAFDAPIAAFWVIVVYAWWRALDERKWGWRLGVLFGLAMATKHNAFFIPIVLLAHFAFIAWQQRRLPSLRPLVWMATLGPIVYLACWPWLWFHTIDRFMQYAAFHLHHVYYNMEYFGRNYNKPPFPLSFPYAMTALTLPVTMMALSIGGAIVMLREWLRQRREKPADVIDLPRGTGFLVFINAIFPMAILTIFRQPIFGATKHFHATIPFMALFAGYAVFALSRSLATEPNRRATRRRRADGVGLRAGAGRVLARASLRAHALQPRRRRTGRWRRSGHEPPVLGLCHARHPALDQPARAAQRARLLARHQPSAAEHGRARASPATRYRQHAARGAGRARQRHRDGHSRKTLQQI